MTSAKTFGLTVVSSSGGEELVLCPFHQDTTPSAWWSPAKELFYCAVCGFGLNGFQLAKRLGVEYESLELDEVGDLEDYDMVVVQKPLVLGDSIYHDYFKERNILEFTIELYGVRWMEEPAAAVLPITDARGGVIGAAYRYQEPKVQGTRYRFVGNSAPIWPMHLLKDVPAGCTIYVTEGSWSAMHLHSYSQFPCFALLGAKANQEIVDALQPFNPVYLYDRDKAGTTACRKMRELAPLSRAFTLNTSPDDMDHWQMYDMFVKLEAE